MSTTTSSGIPLAQALDWARRGQRFYALTPGTDRPMIGAGRENATRDPASLRNWDAQYPGRVRFMPAGPRVAEQTAPAAPTGNNGTGATAQVEKINPFSAAAPTDPPRVPVPCTVFRPMLAKDLPRAEWIVQDVASPGRVTLVVAPPGTGKSAWTLALAVAVATGRGEIVGYDVPEVAPVWCFNAEDEADVLHRRALAALQLHGVAPEALGDRLHLDSGAARPLRLAIGDKSPQPGPDLGDVEAHIRAQGIRLLILDPMVELHGSPENDNTAMGRVVGMVRGLAARTRCAILLVAHTRKPPAASSEGHAGNQDAARGASAMVGAARTVLTLESMSQADAKRYGAVEGERIRYVRLDDAKNNHALKAGVPRWYRKESIILDNLDDVVALRPAQLEEVASPEEIEAARLAADAATALEGDRASVESVAKRLIAEHPMYGDAKLTTIKERLIRAFTAPRTVGGRTWRYVNARLDPGTTGMHWITVESEATDGE